MGNDLAHSDSKTDIQHEPHTDDEEVPLNPIAAPKACIVSSCASYASSWSASTLTTLPSGWEARTDARTHQMYYVDHNTHSTQWNPPDTITKLEHTSTWTTKNTDNPTATVVIHTECDKTNQLSDCWDIIDPRQSSHISVHPSMKNTIFVSSEKSESPTSQASQSQKTNNTSWKFVMGSHIVTKGDYKRWQIKIVPHCHAITTKVSKKRVPKFRSPRSSSNSVKAMIGVVDVESIRHCDVGRVIEREFWVLPHFGYAFCACNGKKYHTDKKGKSYAQKCKIGDTVTVELNRTCNRFIEHNELRFYVNEKVHGLAFNVDPGRNYVLAAALYDDQCALQICD